MANEILVTAKLSFSKSSKSASKAYSALQFTMTGGDYTFKTQSVGTSEEILNLGEIGTPGYIIVKNLDATNFVEFRGASSGADVVKLKPGEVALFRLASTTPYVIADSGACEIEYLLLED